MSGAGWDRVELDLGGEAVRIHLLGIGGAGMSAIADVLVALGHVVSGSDVADSATVEALRSRGVRVEIGHDATNLGDAAYVGVSTAVKPDNPEVVAARAAGIPVMHRFDLLRAIGATRATLSASGTHGKTTTSALLALALEAAGENPSWIVGSSIAGLGGGSRWTDGRWLVLEADESDSTFLAPPRAGAIVTNVEPDHLDHHGTWENLLAAFAEFVDETDGPSVVCLDDAGSARLAGRDGVITYGVDPTADVVVTDETPGASGSSWTVRMPDGSAHRLRIGMPGHHLVLNATAAFTLLVSLGVDPGGVAEGIARYRGAARRYEDRGTAGGVRFVDDYAHTPTEVRAVLSAARSQLSATGEAARLVAVFQPHRYSRTSSLWRDYAGAFDLADVVVITEIYAAGEAPIEGVSGRLVFDAVRGANPDLDVRFMADRSDLHEGLGELLRPGDLCLTMGAGDLTTLPNELIRLRGGSGER